ncbi:MAG: carboxypeptidase regulatory-like domain-containing protein [Planctomycetes bacterium]|nr:carboxypeptidase regulatory-like domain-containing protein [Planctomycetota bacterium]
MRACLRWSIVGLFLMGCDSLAVKGPGTAHGRKYAQVTGQVVDETGKPLAGARVRMGIGDVDMRHLRGPGLSATLVETVTDDMGEFKIRAAVDKPATAHYDVMIAGYETRAGTLRSGHFGNSIALSPGKPAKLLITLRRGLYVAGKVSDEQGNPVPAVKVAALMRLPDSYGFIAVTTTDADGAFEVFDFPPQAERRGDEVEKGEIQFRHPSFLPGKTQDVYSLDEAGRQSLRVILAAGRKATGQVVDAEGKPVADTMVEATFKGDEEEEFRKATMTDAQGRFELRGLANGEVTLRAHALPLKQKAKLQFNLDRDCDNLELRLAPIGLKEPSKTLTVFGMKLADLTPELRDAYDLYHERGVIILDPGKESRRLGIGELAEGDCFIEVGESRIRSTTQFVVQTLAYARNPLSRWPALAHPKRLPGNLPYMCRVVYESRGLDGHGNSTQCLKLTEQDIEELRRILHALE